jgi:hypothetical protein
MTATTHQDDASAPGAAGVRGQRVVGAAVGVVISLLVTRLPRELGVWTYGVGATLGLMGAPAAGLLGWLTAPSVWSGGPMRLVRRGLAVGLAVVPLGVLTILATALADHLGRGTSSAVELFLIIPLFTFYGLVFGLVVLPITLPCGVGWAIAVRTIAAVDARVRRSGDRSAATSTSA